MSTTKNENKKDFRLCVTSNGFRLCVTLNHRDVRIYKSDINHYYKKLKKHDKLKKYQNNNDIINKMKFISWLYFNDQLYNNSTKIILDILLMNLVGNMQIMVMNGNGQYII